MPEVAFSICYRDSAYPDDITAADWDYWGYEKQWSRSASNGVRWQGIHGIDSTAYRAVLTKFGLLDWQNEFDICKVFRMSPAQLMDERRKKEALLGLSPRVVNNDTLGGRHLTAEIYD